jgi:pyridoxal phosphate enzyme (YggS family)
MTEAIAQNLRRVRERIAAAEQRFGRPPGSVSLLAVSKLQPVEGIRAAIGAGQRAFGENYPQEALLKMDQLADQGLEWHFIGRIQGNKTRAIAERFDWVHSLCDPDHARRLNAQRPAHLPPLRACIEVNLDAEPTKAGVGPEALGDLLAICTALPRLAVEGLMTLPAPTPTEAAQRLPFQALRALRDRFATPDQPLRTLSMGMSDDLEAAIAEDATLVRIGTAIFGPRPTR